MTVSPFATKARVRRLEARVAELEARLDRAHARLDLHAEPEFPTVISLNRARSLSAVEARLRAHERSVAACPGQIGRPGPDVLR